ncbi:hypothetical protein KXQ82_19340 [Mucilaginibacter sp. HMF5004]|uniref:hypothetical protein n=1 Tax=Mucilaginibacter rivuli TaxID=2857527 RepID=UPI001C5FF7C2|nr:hypothetical protein [Mucilaginibacter rivuli]MBW4891887.1 hypothetical protein [Mucilaginibacter rivuli]
MKPRVQCPNCLSYRVIIITKNHYIILSAISVIIVAVCGFLILTGNDAGLAGIVIVGGAMTTAITSVVFLVKVFRFTKADAMCVRCGFKFKTGKY